jgi:GYF domain 2
MNYFISRDEQQFGPYTLADLQRYAASGEVLLTDLATSEAMTEPVPVAQIIGTIAVPPAFTAVDSVSAREAYPDPPNLHWGLVLLFGMISFGLFTIVWELVQAAWLKKIEPQSKAIYVYGGAALALLFIFITSFLSGLNHSKSSYAGLLQIVYYVVALVARFSFRKSMEDHFNGPEPMGLALSGAMTFFFGGIYFQYHINDIIRRKAADRAYEMAR